MPPTPIHIEVETMTEITPSDDALDTVLEVRGLSVDFPSRHGAVPAIADVSFDLRLGQTTCFVGESGSGKSVTARAVMNIVEPAVIRGGAINLVDLEAGQKLELSGLDPDGVESRRMAMMFITHDMGVVAEIADQVVVMLHGNIVESRDVDSVFHAPQHAYTRKLLDAALGLNHAPARKRDASMYSAEVLVRTRDLCLTFRAGGRKKGPGVKALDEVSVELHRGEILGIVGESGSGKTTLARVLMGRFQPDSGDATYLTRSGQTVDLTQRASFRDGQVYREMRMIFQDPYGSLNPRMTIEQIIGEPLLVNNMAKGDALASESVSLWKKWDCLPT